jgi:hypothetical protein
MAIPVVLWLEIPYPGPEPAMVGLNLALVTYCDSTLLFTASRCE